MASISIDLKYDGASDHPNTFFRFYENDVLILDNIAQLKFSLPMDDKPDAKYVYQATAVDGDTRKESAKSNAVTINFITPPAPVLSVSLVP